jgi:hypothetical protein
MIDATAVHLPIAFVFPDHMRKDVCTYKEQSRSTNMYTRLKDILYVEFVDI